MVHSRRREMVYKVDWSDEKKREMLVNLLGLVFAVPPWFLSSLR